MKHAHIQPAPENPTLLGNIRAEMGRAQITASHLSRQWGGAVTYWTRRINGELGMSTADLERIAQSVGVHPAELLGGRPPRGWSPTGQYETRLLAGHRPRPLHLSPVA